MSRSEYVYIVQAKGCITPLAAFKRRYEMQHFVDTFGPDDLIMWRALGDNVVRLDADPI